MSVQFLIPSFRDELLKISAKIPFIHGTSGRWDMLRPGVGNTVLKNDPNPRAVYVAMKSRLKMPSISRFANEAAKAKGGESVIAHGKIDTKKGWKPANLSEWGKRNFSDLEEAEELSQSLDSIPDKRARGEVWKKLHKGVGSWTNRDASTSVKPSYYDKVR